jgi:hypothetical protein
VESAEDFATPQEMAYLENYDHGRFSIRILLEKRWATLMGWGPQKKSELITRGRSGSWVCVYPYPYPHMQSELALAF